jgi:hypothetical protein
MPRGGARRWGVIRTSCPKCGSTDIGTRNRCNPCRARASRVEWHANLAVSREANRVRIKQWRAENPDKVQAQDRRRRYNVTPEDVARMRTEQSDRCAICGDPSPDCVDHCHATKRVRGLLCRRCNAGLGQFRDRPEILHAAIAYLGRFAVPPNALDIEAQNEEGSATKSPG